MMVCLTLIFIQMGLPLSMNEFTWFHFHDQKINGPLLNHKQWRTQGTKGGPLYSGKLTICYFEKKIKLQGKNIKMHCIEHERLFVHLPSTYVSRFHLIQSKQRLNSLLLYNINSISHKIRKL